MIDPNLKEFMESNPEAVELEINRRQQYWPLKDLVPNRATRKMLKPYVEPHSTYPGKYPFIKINRAGNGTGKTMTLAVMLGGVSLGLTYMNPKYFFHQYFKDCEETRKRRRLKVRIICKAVDVEENGSVYQEIAKWIPIAQFEGKNSGGYYSRIRIPAPSAQYNETVIDIKTFDMPVVAHAGPDYDLILVNEPAPQDIYNENVGRCRRGGRMALFLTPLDQAEYLAKLENGEYPDGELDVTETSIWDNCKDIPGTDGILEKHEIDRMIRQWRENNELELPARVDGKYVHLHGAIYQAFNQDIHVIDPMPIDPKWNIYKIIDPHEGGKPPFCVWIAVAPSNRCYVFAEYPNKIWTTIDSTVLTIRDFVEEFKRIETGKNENFAYIKNQLKITECLGDPNMFSEKQPNTGLTMREEYERHGCEDINTKINDDLRFRHDRVREFIKYDPMRAIDSINSPNMFFFRTVPNVIRAMKNYGYKTKPGLSGGLTDKVDKKHKCPMDCVGLFAVHFEGYIEKSIEEQAFYDQYSENCVDEDQIEGYINNNHSQRFI